MRRILVDKARRKTAQKRGGGVRPEELFESRIELRAPPDEVLAVHEALDELGSHEPVAARVVKLRYFVGMTVPEIAESLELSVSTVERQWRYARAWLKAAMQSRQ
jgi:RNA polymerase sigma factor (TIGR02999 family)